MYQPHIFTQFLKCFPQTYYYDTEYHDLINYDYIPLNQCNVPDLYKSLFKYGDLLTKNVFWKTC